MDRRLVSRAVEIYRNHGLDRLLVALYDYFGGQCLGDERDRLLWRYYHLLGYDCRCDFDTSKITRVAVDPKQIRWMVKLPEYWSDDNEYCPVYGDNAIVGELAGWWDRFRRPIPGSIGPERYEEAVADGSVEELPWAELFRSIKNEYKSQQELGDDRKIRIRGTVIPDEPRLAVSRNDEFMRWTGGLHRIAAAQALGIDKVFAYVVVWHPEANREQVVDTFELDESDYLF